MPDEEKPKKHQLADPAIELKRLYPLSADNADGVGNAAENGAQPIAKPMASLPRADFCKS